MKVYILGAGASYHAAYPLAAQLGVELYKWVKQASPSSFCPRSRLEEYRNGLDSPLAFYGTLEDFEQIVTDLDLRENSDRRLTSSRPLIVPDLQSAIADFFFDVQHDSAPLYERLAAEGVDAGDVVITFNYDTALEHALKKAGRWEISNGYGFEILPEYPTSSVRVLKLHGSANWIQCLGGPGFSVGHPLDKRPAIMPQDMDALGYENLRDPKFGPGGAHRRLVLPSRSKQFDQQLFGGLWSQAAWFLRKATEIIVIGYSFPDADKRSHELIDQVNPLSEVTVASRDDGPKICELFRSHYPRRVTDVGSFEDWVDKPRPTVYEDIQSP